MFNNARTYNQEGSWVYNDAEEMERVFEAAVDRYVIATGLLNALNSVTGSSGSGGYDSALTPLDDDEPISRPRSKSGNRKAVISDDDYSSDED